MSQYCVFVSAFLCYTVVGVTCASCAAADLLSRFKSGNRIKSILYGPPQIIFYILNVGAGLLALFGSEALGSTQIIVTASSNMSLAVVKASGFALATFISFRTTVSTLISSENGKKIEIGPGRLFAALLENVERRIDQDRMVKASDEIKTIVSLSPRAVFNVVLPYCFDQAEKDPGDRKSITDALAAIYTDSDQNISPNERSALMLSHLHKIFGLSVLLAAKELVEHEDVEAATQGFNKIAPLSSDIVPTESSDMLKSQDPELDKLLQQLRSNQ